MAKLIKAINEYRPKLILGKSVQMNELVEYLSGRTGLNKGEIQLVLSELSNSIIFFNKRGQGVKLDGLGTYLPNIDVKGELTISHRVSTEIRNAINQKGAYIGDIENRENIGMTNAEIISLWNEKHPTDPVS